jgi:holo-[acyl-carrier protein] synthase
MIVGIGTDLVHIPRMQKLIDKHGDSIARRILSDKELQRFNEVHNPAAFLAKRFAAKEATAKALGTGVRDGLSLQHLAVENDALGKPELQFYQQGQIMKQRMKIGKTMVSLSDEGEYAIAFVTLMELRDESVSDN